MDDIEVYSEGMYYLSVCAHRGCTREDVLRHINKTHPTGIKSSWQIASEDFKTGESNPHTCQMNSDRVHWLLQC